MGDQTRLAKAAINRGGYRAEVLKAKAASLGFSLKGSQRTDPLTNRTADPLPAAVKRPEPEEWRDIDREEGLSPGIYQISSHGRLRSRRKIMPGGGLNSAASVLKGHLFDGYRRYSISCDNGTVRSPLAHRLVAIYFIGPPLTDKPDVLHIDGNRTNNHFSNLKWGSKKDNYDDMLRHGTTINLRGTGRWIGPVWPKRSRTPSRPKVADLPGEIWRWVDFIEGLHKRAYAVSNKGRVKSYRSGASSPSSTSRVLLNGSINKQGYRQHNLRRDDKIAAAWTAHRLVLWAFVGPPPEDKNDGRHLDGDRLNNCLSNLAWGSRKENAADAVRHGTTTRGMRNASAKMTEDNVLEAVEMYNQGNSIREISDHFEVNFVTIFDIIHGRSWAHLTGIPLQKPGTRKGGKHKNAKLTEETAAKALRRVLIKGESQSSVARDLGVHPVTIGDLVRGQTWKHLLRPSE